MEALKYNRRQFIKTSLGLGSLLALEMVIPSSLLSQPVQKLIILHTNDVHSRILPFPDNAKETLKNKGGFSRRAAFIKRIRQSQKNVLLFDSGDILQGTPYFNFFHGEPEFRLMSEMGYNAAVLGNHEFDMGIDNLAASIEQFASFPFIVSNYDVENTPLKGLLLRNKIFHFGHLKVGVYGLGINPDGLIPADLCTGLSYIDPIESMSLQEKILSDAGCQLIICLSHLGYNYEDNRVSDVQIARNCRYTHLILGGHTHTFLENPVEIKNQNNGYTYIFQNGWGGVRVGSIEVNFTSHSKPLTLKKSLLTN